MLAPGVIIATISMLVRTVMTSMHY